MRVQVLEELELRGRRSDDEYRVDAVESARDGIKEPMRIVRVCLASPRPFAPVDVVRGENRRFVRRPMDVKMRACV